MRISQRRGAIVMRLEPAEVTALRQLLDDLDAVLAGDAEQAVTDRLFPAAYADDGAAADFRALTESGLRDGRTERVAACRAELAGEAGTVAVDLSDPDAARRWIQVVNDLRLTLGTRLGVTEDDRYDPSDTERMIYHWLTAVQDRVVTALMP